MKIIEVDNINKYLVGAVPIGIGTSAICFLMPNKKILKVYHSPLMKKIIFEHKKNLEIEGNDTYIFPDEILVKNNTCLAQIYDYIPAKTLHGSSHLRISKIIKAYDKLFEDTIDISKKCFRLCDLHDRNILFNDLFYVIDLDRGYQDESMEKYIFHLNMKNINQVILYFLFKIKDYQILQFDDENLKKLYSKSLSDPYEFVTLLNKIMDYTDDAYIKTLSKKISHEKFINSYYKF